MSEKVLVTGATGFIGSHLVRQLVDGGEDVRVLVRNPGKLSDIGLDPKRLDIVKGDLLKPETIPKALKDVARMYHAAGYFSTAPCERTLVQLLNYDITFNLFEAAKKAELQKAVYLSSVFALAGASREPVDENTAYNLAGMDISYFRARRKAESYAWRCQEDGLPLVFVYPCFCLGPGDVHVTGSKMVVDHLDRKVSGYMTGGRNLMDVRDAASGAVGGMVKGKVGQRYIIGGQNMPSDEIFGALSEITGYPKPVLRIPLVMGKAAGRVLEVFSQEPYLDREAALIAGNYWYYDDSKARRKLGHTSRPVRETLEDSVNWFVDNGYCKPSKKLASSVR